MKTKANSSVCLSEKGNRQINKKNKEVRPLVILQPIDNILIKKIEMDIMSKVIQSAATGDMVPTLELSIRTITDNKIHSR